MVNGQNGGQPDCLKVQLYGKWSIWRMVYLSELRNKKVNMEDGLCL